MDNIEFLYNLTLKNYILEEEINNDIKFKTSTKGITVGTGVTIETNGQSNFSGISTFNGDVAVYGSKFKLPVGTSNPSSPLAGDSYFNTSAKTFKIYDGAGNVGENLGHKEIENLALNHQNIVKFLKKTPKKIIYIPNKIINIVL